MVDRGSEVSAQDLALRGIELQLQGDMEGAKIHFLAALDLDPRMVPALMNLSQIASEANQLRSAEVWVKRALSIASFDADNWAALGNLMTRMDRYDEANTAIERALNLAPEKVSIWHNAGLLRMRQRLYEDAVVCFEKVKALGSDPIGRRNDLAHALLSQGNLDEGLRYYEARWGQLPHLTPWDYHVPEWQGEDLKDKVILVHAEQGHGDTIMTLRFVPDLIKMARRVVVSVPRDMAALVTHMGFDVLAIEDISEDAMLGFDYHTPMMSMMRWLKIQVSSISPEPYIKIKAGHASPRSGRVGICWASGRRNTDHDTRGRYTDLLDWLPLAQLPGVQLVSLQKGADSEDIQRLHLEGLIDDGPIAGAKNFLDTAEVISTLDVVVSVDTAVVHLAGAMGKPVIMLAQYSNCWRWWNIEQGLGTPWYSDVMIVRQPEPRVWDHAAVKRLLDMTLGREASDVAAE